MLASHVSDFPGRNDTQYDMHIANDHYTMHKQRSLKETSFFYRKLLFLRCTLL